MPAVQATETIGQKRKSDQLEQTAGTNKRQSFGPAQDVTRNVEPSRSGERYWMVQWRIPQFKKHKTWDGDGVLVLSGLNATLYDTEGKLLNTGKSSLSVVGVGDLLRVGGKDIEIDRALTPSEYFSGACFGRGQTGAEEDAQKATYSSSSSLSKKFVALKPVILNPSRPGLSASQTSEKKSIALHPVDLLQQSSCENSVISKRDTHWTANWRKPQHKKHKTWDGDGYVTCSGDKLKLITDDGKLIGTTQWSGIPLVSGYQFTACGRTVELDAQVLSHHVPNVIGILPPDSFQDGSVDLELSSILGVDEHPLDLLAPNYAPGSGAGTKSSSRASPATAKKYISPANFYAKPSDVNKGKGPLHDPHADGAVVLKGPNKDHEKKYNAKNRPIVPVVVDPIIARHLRPHQKEGVKFLYECVMGLRKHEGQGCILADEMGMGKTLQTIALVWTVLKQTPYARGPPIAGKVLIVCPVSLVNNWRKEFHKWLGRDRIGVFVGDKDKAAIKQFVNSKIHQVLVVGYEKLRTVISELAYCMPPIGLIICDEGSSLFTAIASGKELNSKPGVGHRLKSANNKTSTMFEALRTPRRIILSGTPIQNDLGEFHAMADFCNPGLLDDYNTFRRVYEIPILKSRAPGSTRKELEIGEARAAQLLAISKSFVLRRDATILNNYLPPKHEYVVFVTPTSLQKSMFAKILQPDTLSSIIGGPTARSLALIGLLTKISNSPILLKSALEKGKAKAHDDTHELVPSTFEDALKLLPHDLRPEDITLSGKLAALGNILRAIRKNTEEKCIVVSHYTSTLNIIESFCKKKNYTYLRLDGQTPAPKRQEYVDTFNRSTQSQNFIFLLSAKAGGVGLNLIGASRLCLIDSDWNPSHDLQAMARIHRDGQKRPVFIYRLLTAGTIDEKIYQRQVTKLGLSDSLMGNGAADGGGKSKSDSFSHKELRDLFTIHHNTACHTHDLLGCECSLPAGRSNLGDNEMNTDESGGDDDSLEDFRPSGFTLAAQIEPETFAKIDKAFAKKKKAALAALSEWTHINCLQASAHGNIHDSILRSIVFNPPADPDLPATQAPTSTRNALLEAIDVDRFATADAVLTVDDVPGGTVSFLFEKGSSAGL